jgi:hypothetical protein
VTVFGSSGPMVAFTEELRLRSAPIVALATRPIPLEPIESPRSTPAVTDGTIVIDAETSIRVMVLLPTPTPTPALPTSPIEGVIAASTQILSALPPAEHDVDGTEVVAVSLEESAMPGFKPMLALACTPTPVVPMEIPRSALAATEGAIAKVADASIIVMVLLPRAMLITPPAPTEGVMVASRQISSRLSKTEQVTDEDGAAIVTGVVLMPVIKDAASATEVEGMISVTEGHITDEVGSGMCGVIDRLASTSITVPVDTALLVATPEFTTVVSPCAEPDDVSSPEDDCVTVIL